MKKLLTLASLITLKISSVFAYHGTETTGSSSLPIYESGIDNLLYLALPFFVYSFILNEVMQLYLEKRYSDTSLKDAADHRDITIGASAALTFILVFSPLFQSLPSLEVPVYAGLMGGVLIAAVFLNRKEDVRKFYRDKFEQDEE